MLRELLLLKATHPLCLRGPRAPSVRRCDRSERTKHTEERLCGYRCPKQNPPFLPPYLCHQKLAADLTPNTRG